VNEALLLIGPVTAFGQTAVSAIGGTTFRVMDQKIHTPVDRTAIHPPPHQPEGDGGGVTHLDVLRTMNIIRIFHTSN